MSSKQPRSGLSTGAKWAIGITVAVVLIIVIALIIWLLTRGNGGNNGDNGGGTTPPSGCTSNASCSGNTPICNTSTGVCVGCLLDTDCEASQECQQNTCSCVSITATPTIDTFVFDSPGTVSGTYTESGLGASVTYEVEISTSIVPGQEVLASSPAQGGTFSANFSTDVEGNVYARMRAVGTGSCSATVGPWTDNSVVCRTPMPDIALAAQIPTGVAGFFNHSFTFNTWPSGNIQYELELVNESDGSALAFGTNVANGDTVIIPAGPYFALGVVEYRLSAIDGDNGCLPSSQAIGTF